MTIRDPIRLARAYVRIYSRRAWPRFGNLRHRCEHCERRFHPWSRVARYGDTPVFHDACAIDPVDGGYRLCRAAVTYLRSIPGLVPAHPPCRCMSGPRTSEAAKS